MAPKIIIFDFDGVLADTLEFILSMGRQVSARLGFPSTPTAEDLSVLETMHFSEYGRQLGLPEEHIQPFVQGCVELFNQKEQPPGIFTGMVEVVHRLAATNKLGIVTGSPANVVNKFLREHDLEQEIGVILGADFPGARPEKLSAAIRGLGGEDGSPAFMVGDSVSDIRAARVVGAVAIAVGWGHQSSERLRAEKPDHLVETPAELLRLLTMNR